VRWLLPILGFALACGAGPEQDDAESYVSAMQAPLAQNAALAQRFLTDASQVKRHETDGGKLVEQLSRELAPQAEALSKQIAGIEPEQLPLRDAHAILVRSWADRASAYGGMRDAWTAGDLAAWDAAQRKNTQSKLDEERYFTEVNRYLSAYKLSVEQFPE
jgi:hypothetical protein